MFDKTWCNKCMKYMTQTTVGCIVCGTINWNYKFSSTVADNKKENYLDPVEDYSDLTEPT